MTKELRVCPCCGNAPELNRCGYYLFYGCGNDEPMDHDYAGLLCRDAEEAAESWNESVEAGWFDETEEEIRYD